MNVIGSTVTPKRERVYHRANCIYEKRILPKNRVIMGPKQAEERQYGACKYCGGLLGEVRVKREIVSSWE